MIKKQLVAAIVAAVAFLSPVKSSSANPLEALGGIVSSLTSSSKFDVASLVGEWQYQSPAVSFKSDQALSKIGGAAASGAIEDKMKPYYEKIGLNTMKLTVEAGADSTYNFQLGIRGVNLKGTLVKNGDDGALTFNFSAFGRLKIGSISAQAVKSADNVLSLTFDIKGFLELVRKVASVSGSSSVQTLGKLLDSYDGIFAGAKLKKTSGGQSAADSQQAAPAQSGASGLGDVLKGLGSKAKKK